MAILEIIKEKLTKKGIIALSVIILLFIGWRIYAAKNSALKITTFQVTRGDVEETISTSGKVDAEKRADLTFPTSGKLAWVGVKSGDLVTYGQEIAALDTTTLNSAYMESINTYMSLNAAAQKAEDDVKGHSSDETFTQKETRMAAETARDSAYDAMKAAQQTLSQAVLYAPFAGIVAAANPENAGINISPLSAVYTIVDPSTLYFSTEVSETDIAKIKEGEDVTLTLDAYPDKTFTSKVGVIDFSSTVSSTGGTAYHVKIEIPHTTDIYPRLGMNGDAEIIIQTAQNTLYVPADSLIQEGDKNYVWTVVSGKAKKVEVKTGVFSLDKVEILEGLNEGEKVVSQPPSKIKEGMSLKTS